MKFKELTQLSKEEQEKKLSELALELIKLNAQVAIGTPPKNAGQIKKIKKDIARIMFIKGQESKSKTRSAASKKNTSSQELKNKPTQESKIKKQVTKQK